MALSTVVIVNSPEGPVIFGLPIGIEVVFFGRNKLIEYLLLCKIRQTQHLLMGNNELKRIDFEILPANARIVYNTNLGQFIRYRDPGFNTFKGQVLDPFLSWAIFT